MTQPRVRLGDVAEFIRGITFKPDDVVPLDANDAVVCMRTKNVQTLLDCDDLLAVPSQFVRRKDQYLDEGDILVSSANSWNLVGKCCWVPALPWRAAFGGFISALRGNNARVDKRYLYWWFASERIQALLRSFGQKTTNISNLNFERCLQLELPLPPLPEQRRIAAVLDKADALRAKRRDALVKLDCLAQSTFVEMFGNPDEHIRAGETMPLSEVVAPGRSVTYGIVQAGPEVPDGVPYIKTGDIRSGRILEERLSRTSLAIAEDYARSAVSTGDIVISIRATVGTTAVVPPSLDGANLTQGTARISPGESVRAAYLLSYLRTEAVQRWIQTQVKGATFREITLGRLRELPVHVPKLSQQDKFVGCTNALAMLESRNTASLVELDALFASLQQRAFRGAL